MSDVTPAPKPKAVSPYAAPLRLVAVGALRMFSLGLSALADAVEDKKD